jgi:hypothetical protein
MINPNWKPNEADLFVQDIKGRLEAFRKMPKKKREEFYTRLRTAERNVRSPQVRAAILYWLDIFHVELFGYSERDDYQTKKYKNQQEKANVLDAEYLTQTRGEARSVRQRYSRLIESLYGEGKQQSANILLIKFRSWSVTAANEARAKLNELL